MRLVLLGGGHGHLATIHNIPALRRIGYTVTVVDPSDRLFYSGMIASVIGGRAARASGVIPIARLTRDQQGTFIQSAAERIDHTERTVVLSNGCTIPWDVLSCAVGSTTVVPFPVERAYTSALVPTKPFSLDTIEKLDALTSTVQLAVIGGGASGVELAGNLMRRMRSYRETDTAAVDLFASSSRLLPGLPPEAGRIAGASLRASGIDFHVETAVSRIDDGMILTENKTRNGPYDLVFVATGLGTPEVFRNSRLPVDDAGALAVAPTLKAYGLPVFAVGDCAAVGTFNLDKVGVHAVRQGHVLLENLKRYIQGRELQSYRPPRKYLQIINLGDGTAIAINGRRARHGRFWMELKERIDWSYVRSRGRSIFPSFTPPPKPSSSPTAGDN